MVVKVGSLELGQWGERADQDVCLRDLASVLRWNMSEEKVEMVIKKVQRRREGHMCVSGVHIAWEKEKKGKKVILTVLVW